MNFYFDSGSSSADELLAVVLSSSSTSSVVVASASTDLFCDGWSDSSRIDDVEKDFFRIGDNLSSSSFSLAFELFDFDDLSCDSIISP